MSLVTNKTRKSRMRQLSTKLGSGSSAHWNIYLGAVNIEIPRWPHNCTGFTISCIVRFTRPPLCIHQWKFWNIKFSISVIDYWENLYWAISIVKLRSSFGEIDLAWKTPCFLSSVVIWSRACTHDIAGRTSLIMWCCYHSSQINIEVYNINKQPNI